MDNIVVYGDKDGVVFRSRHEYKLEKTGIPAYKLIVEEGGEPVTTTRLQVENSQYVIIMNSVATGGCVGLMITLNNTDPIIFHKDQIVFRVECGSNDNKELISNDSNNKESITNDTSKFPTNFTDTSAIPEFSSNGTSKTSSVFNKYYVESKSK